MNISQQVAKHFREIYFGGNWTEVTLRDSLADVSWQQATTKIDSLNTIAALVYHMHYYVRVATPVLEGKPLDASDTFSFNHPPIHSAEDWQDFLEKVWEEAEQFAVLIERIPGEKFDSIFAKEKHGSYYRNIHGIIEHAHYHLGQIVLLKKLMG